MLFARVLQACAQILRLPLITILFFYTHMHCGCCWQRRSCGGVAIRKLPRPSVPEKICKKCYVAASASRAIATLFLVHWPHPPHSLTLGISPKITLMTTPKTLPLGSDQATSSVVKTEPNRISNPNPKHQNRTESEPKTPKTEPNSKCPNQI